MNLEFTLKELKKVPTIVFDLDGTVTDFRKLDNKIIREEIFLKHKGVLLIDKIAWLVNSLDLIKNTTLMLKLRLMIYSVLAQMSYTEVINTYKDRYLKYSKEEIYKNRKVFLNLKEKGYHVIVLSNNKMADDLYLDEAEIVSVNSKLLEIRKIQKDCHIIFFVGNNLMDDLVVARLLKLRGIYVGKSRFIPKNMAYAKIKKLKTITNIKKSGY